MVESRSILLDTDIGAISAEDLESRSSNLPLRAVDDVLSALETSEEPTALIVSRATWNDKYLDVLSPGDWVTTIGVGYENFPLDKLAEGEVAFTHCPGISAPQVAEHVFGTTFSFTRNLWTYREQQCEGKWEKHRWKMTDFSGDICCILGLGNIGDAVAKRANAFGMTVRGIKRTITGYDGPADSVYSPDALLNAASNARLFVISVPLTDETRGIVDGTVFDVLADDAIIVNVARGRVLATEQLLSALQEDRLGGVCLDVTDPEPLPASHPLWDRKDVLVTPHCAGSSDKYPTRFAERFLEQYSRWKTGEKLHHRIV
jgi:D-2-hydroxyacid dehydrogenase (NADP+)